MNRDILDRWLERCILATVLSILVLMPLAFGGRPQPAARSAVDFLLLEPFLLAQSLTILALLLWVIRIWVDPKPRLLLPPICWAVLSFAIYAGARYWTADIEYAARQEVIRIAVYAILFFIILNNLHRQEATQLTTLVLIVLAMCISFYAIYQFAMGSDRVWHLTKPYHHRGSGTFISPNHLGGFLEMVLPLALAYTIIGRFKAVTKVLLGYASLVILAGIAVTMSRGAWIATILSVLGFFGLLLMYRPFRLPSLIALAVLLAAGLFVLPANNAFQGRAKQLYSGGKVDDDTRFALWQPAIKVWRENLWWGAGPAHFDYRFRAFRPEEIQASPDQAHNDFLSSLADFGIVGTACIGVALGLLAWGVAKTWGHLRKTPRDLGGTTNSSKTAFVLGAVTGLLAIFLHSAVDFNMHIPANAILAVALMALLSSHLRFATDNYWVTARIPGKLLVTFISLGLIGILALQSWKRGHESYWIAKAALTPGYSPQRLEYLKKAFTAEPKNSETAALLGETCRFRSAQSPDNYVEWAQHAMEFFGTAMKLNPWDSTAPLLYGWCLDWSDRLAESGPYFEKAEELDPNSYYTMAQIGVHYVEAGKLAAAKAWLERSLRLERQRNTIALRYMDIVNSRLMDAADRKKPSVQPQQSSGSGQNSHVAEKGF